MDSKWLNLLTTHQDFDALFKELYLDLKQMARARMSSERAGATLNTTALVHEAWLRLEKSSPDQWRDRAQFFFAASEAMRRILVEAGRRRMSAKRGSGEAPVPLENLEIGAPEGDQRLIEVHEVLDQLEAEDEMKARIVKLRFFCGMENEEIADILGVNERTVRRHWELAKIWLYRAIQNGE